MEEKIEDYVFAYVKHKGNLVGADDTTANKEAKIMENIVQGAVLKFGIKRAEFTKLVE
jgi:hypothetical protein